METPETYTETFISVLDEVPHDADVFKMFTEYVNKNEILLPENIDVNDFKVHVSNEIYGKKVTVSFIAIKKKNQILQPNL